MKILILLILAFTSFSLKANDATTASFIANNISYLSAHSAKQYLLTYKTTFVDCINKKIESSKSDVVDRRFCSQEALAKVDQFARPFYSQRILDDRIRILRRDGHLTNYGIRPIANKPMLGVIGDSVSVGAMAADQLQPHLGSLIFSGLVDFLLINPDPKRSEYDLMPTDFELQAYSRVLRVFDTPSERKFGLERFFENKGSRFIDCEECSFPFYIARSLGYNTSNIVFAGQSGKRINTIYEQLKRLNVVSNGLPKEIIVSYNGNDLCKNSDANKTPQQKYDEYYKIFMAEFSNALDNLKSNEQDTMIYIVASIDIANLLVNESVLSREVNYWVPGLDQEKVTCKDLRTKKIPGADAIAKLCPRILNTRPDDLNRVAHIKSLHRAVVEAQKNAVLDLNLRSRGSIRFQFLESSLNVEFNSEDIAADCFHPSTKGHDKIAQTILKEIVFIKNNEK